MPKANELTILSPESAVLPALLRTALTAIEVASVLGTVEVPDALASEAGDFVSRAALAQALNLLLFQDLVSRVPTGQAYVDECVAAGRKIVFDHGALRTVALTGMGSLPAGHQAIGRILEPLGYQVADLYPLEHLGMTGRAYAHQDMPADLPQFFVSELHPEKFSAAFQSALVRVTATSRDPLTAGHHALLQELAKAGQLPLTKARLLLLALFHCFGRHHAIPSMSDYELLLAESPEMAWIATEGNAFNHATDRVADLDAVVADQRSRLRPLKDKIEVSRSGRVKQTAFRADSVQRAFTESEGRVSMRSVPGSFFEFIQRESMRDELTGRQRLDLAFDSGNAQGIFKMTASAR
jgi:hypothetical protein